MTSAYKGKSHKEILHKIYAKALALLNENKIEWSDPHRLDTKDL